jgi:RNA polymerase primary sigma factor
VNAPPRRSGHSDLDEVLASLEALSRDSALDFTAIADSDIAKDEVEEEEETSVEDSFQQYSARISRVPLLSPQEEIHLARLARNGGPAQQDAAKQRLVEANLRLVISIALRRSGTPTLPIMDIIQEGNIGLMRAIDRFDPERGQRLSSYATWWIRQSINRAIAEQARSMRLPGHLYEAIEKVQRVRRELEQKLNRQPSKQELAEATAMTPVQIDEALRAATRPVSLERPVGEEEDVELGEIISDPNADTAEASFSRSELHEELGRVLQTLPERERVIVMKRFGLGDYESGGPQNLDDIADGMNLSRERVRQLELRALRKLRRAARGTTLATLFGADDGDE